jgi:dethiobiotin synthetase
VIVFVTGTGTEVGKTWTLTRVLGALRTDGHRVAARKPAQSYAPDELGATDAELLADAIGVDATDVCPAHRWYATPMAPPMAAAVLGEPPFTIADLARETTAPPDATATFVEGAGGPRSPLASDGDNVDLARALGAAVAVLVADAGLGTINAVRMAVDAFTGFDTLVCLNRFDPDVDLHRRNRAWLADDGYQILASPAELAAELAARLP